MNSRFRINPGFLSLFLVITLGLSSLPARSQKPYKREPSPAAVKWANEELRRMTLDEKIGQLISVGINATFLNQDSEAYRTLKHYIEDDKVGGLVLFRGPVYESV